MNTTFQNKPEKGTLSAGTDNVTDNVNWDVCVVALTGGDNDNVPPGRQRPPKLTDNDNVHPGLEPPKPADYSAWCWTQLDPADFAYLTAARNHPSPCPWCGGRLVHNRLCDELRSSWQPTMPFGKHKGKPLHGVPGDYLHWVLAGDYARPELREHVEAEIKQRKETPR